MKTKIDIDIAQYACIKKINYLETVTHELNRIKNNMAFATENCQYQNNAEEQIKYALNMIEILLDKYQNTNRQLENIKGKL